MIPKSVKRFSEKIMLKKELKFAAVRGTTAVDAP